jgi:hypothetical protein
MTPAELLVLFSSYVITALLVWFANVADRVRESKSEAAGGEHEQSVPAFHGGMTDWNVAAFFGLRRHADRLLMGSAETHDS